MEKRPLNVDPEEVARSVKARRVSRACLQCRTRKQRCLPCSDESNPQVPCQRCRHHGIACSFETDQFVGSEAIQSPSRMADVVVSLQRQLLRHEARIAELERQFNSAPLPGDLDFQPGNSSRVLSPPPSQPDADGAQPSQFQQITTPISRSPHFNMDSIDLGPPIATLRSLGDLSKEAPMPASPSSQSPMAVGVAGNQNSFNSEYDPVSQHVISLHDAHQAVNIYFEYCQPMAPVLSAKLRLSIQNLRKDSPTLFLAICSVGARYWNGGNSRPDVTRGVHKKFYEITSLLDKAVSRLLLRPTPYDVTLDSIRVLLLYAQWMPCSQESQEMRPGEALESPRPSRRTKSRYNEISAWAVLGLATRYAQFLGLDRNAIAPFEGDPKSVLEEDLSRLRVWNNLVTCDCNLMLTSGLPASLDPSSAARVAKTFASYGSVLPDDLRGAALVELAAIIYHATRPRGDSAGRPLDSLQLRKVNSELDEWERSWETRLRYTEAQHVCLPFTSVRWYRLALNSASLGPFLSSLVKPDERQLQVWLLQSLETSLTAASQIIFSLSSYGKSHVWRLESQNLQSFPQGPFSVDNAAVDRLFYSVDSTWISHTFAVIFVVLCYIKGIVDDNLQIRTLTPTATLGNCAPLTPRETSIIAKLVLLALAVFDDICQTPSFHHARDFHTIIRNTASLVLAPQETNQNRDSEIDDLAMQSILDLMNESGLEWPGISLENGQDLPGEWDVSQINI